MFIPNDGITEIVAHFIGYFQIRIEDARFRPDYQDFVASPLARPNLSEIRSNEIHFQEKLEIDPISVDVAYTPSVYESVKLTVSSSVTFNQIDIVIPAGPRPDDPAFNHLSPMANGPQLNYLQEATAPGSTILIASQVKYLHDDDVLVVGNYDFDARPRLSAHDELEELATEALHVSSSLGAFAELHSVPQMLGLMSGAPDIIDALGSDDFTGVDSLYLQIGDRIDGRFSNGTPVEALPVLQDALGPRQRLGEDVEVEDEQLLTDAYTIDASQMPTTMNVSSGGNLALNEVAIVNAGLPNSVIAVAGDYHRIDAIFQTNALRDTDTIDGNWPAANLSVGGNILQNSASFINHDNETKTGVESVLADGFPNGWNVTVVDGDMTFLNWVYQYNFTSDNDTQILTAMGTNTTISTGLNLGFDSMTFANLGLYYDLIFVGGQLYDGNFVTQTNVLLDSDDLAVFGTSPAFKGSATTGENLLWNDATIENVGADAWTQGLPAHYDDAFTGMAAGDKSMPAGFKSDAALDGFGNLKVLYITGDVYDINHINQVNMVGDADHLAIYEDNLLKAQDSVWKVSTGHNTLINKAKIVDYDSLGKSAFVGGQIYSDAVLVQAEILEGLTDRLTVRGNELANEVIAFLDDQTDIASMLSEHPAFTSSLDSSLSHDALQSVLA